MCMQNCTFNPQSPFNLLKLKIKVREDNRLNPEKFFHLFLHLPEKFSVILSKLLAFPLFHPFFFFIQTTKSIYPSLHQLFESLVVQPPWTTLQSQSKLTLNFCLHTRAVSWDDPALPVPCQELLLLALWPDMRGTRMTKYGENWKCVAGRKLQDYLTWTVARMKSFLTEVN